MLFPYQGVWSQCGRIPLLEWTSITIGLNSQRALYPCYRNTVIASICLYDEPVLFLDAEGRVSHAGSEVGNKQHGPIYTRAVHLLHDFVHHPVDLGHPISN